MYKYSAKLIRVIDGDTIDAMIDLGFNMWAKKRVRLNGIDTPETRTRDLNEKARGIKAKERLIEILNNSGNEFIIVSQGVDKYGRCLGEIFINDKSVNKILLDEGLAVPYGGGKKK